MAKRTRLTKAVVDSLTPKAAEFVVYDSDERRLALRIYPTGRKVYLVRMRVDGRQRWYTIGPHGDPWTVETARDEARRVLGQSANVVKLRETGAAPPSLLHPIEARDRDRKVPTVAEFAQRYLDDYATPHKAPATVAADRSLLGLRESEGESKPGSRTIVGALGEQRIDRVTRSEITDYHLSLKDTPTRANRALSLLSHMFAMAERWGVRQDNPCRHVQRFPESRRERFLSAAELARVGAAIAKATKRNTLTPYGLAALKLLIFTGARASEILTLQRTAVDMATGTARVNRKGRVMTLHFPPPALQILKDLPRVQGNPHVIVGGRRGRPLTIWGLEQVWQEIRRAARVPDVRVHDLRHSWASVAAAQGQSLPIIGALLGHTQPATTARYAHLADDPLRAAAAAVAQDIASAMTPKASRKATVTPLAVGKRRARR